MIALDLNRGNMQTVGEFIIEWRLSKGYGQKELAEMLDVSRVHISHVENDKFTHPKDFILKLKKVMSKKEYADLVECSCNNHRAGLE